MTGVGIQVTGFSGPVPEGAELMHRPDRQRSDGGPCPQCRGSGQFRGSSCRNCKGRGTVAMVPILRWVALTPEEVRKMGAFLETLPRHLSLRRVVVADEYGGSVGSAGEAQIVAGLNGQRMQGFILPGKVPNGSHAVFYYPALLVVRASWQGSSGQGEVRRIALDPARSGLYSAASLEVEDRLLWRFRLDRPEFPEVASWCRLQYPLEAVRTAVRKSRTEGCQGPMYVDQRSLVHAGQISEGEAWLK